MLEVSVLFRGSDELVGLARGQVLKVCGDVVRVVRIWLM